MNEIKLLPHNQDMVNKIENAMIFGNHKIFYTEATGLGKSFIFMYLVNKYFRDKKVLYICPKNCIWTNMTSYEEFEIIKDCVTMLCNADFNKIKDHHLGYDAIFIDEAHHLTAPVQGDNIRMIMNMTIEENPNAYVFGFTATPEIDGETVGDKYFDISIIGMDMLQAIDVGILQKIHYAIAVRDDFELENDEKNLLIKYNLNTTHNMVSDLVNQYSHIRHWLAYFSRIDELNDNIESFKKYFPDFKVFVIHSDVDDCDNVLNEFETYAGKAILASVSMVLEGIHPKTVEGILLYRNVSMSNTFLQIIGRLGIINPNTTPVFVDIYGTFNDFVESKNMTELTDSNNIRGQYKFRDHIYMNVDTYKLIEFATVINNIRNEYKYIEYRGLKWKNITGLANQLDIALETVKKYREKGWTYEQIIDYVLDGNVKQNGYEPMEYRGLTWTSDTELSKLLNISITLVGYHRRKGWTYEQIIDYVLDGNVKQHGYEPMEYRGLTWTSDTELSRLLGKAKSFVKRHRIKGHTYEQIIDYVLDGNVRQHGYEPMEYHGLTWTSDMELSRLLGISSSLVKYYREKGWTYDQIIDYVLDGNIKQNGYEPMEYRGLTWTSDTELSKLLGKSETFVSSYRRKGWTYEQIIDHGMDFVQNPNNKRLYKRMEYRGLSWLSNRDLANQLGISPSSITLYRQKGMTYEQIIDAFMNGDIGHDKHKLMEYRGLKWTTNASLAKQLCVYDTFISKYRKKGWTYEQIIDYVLDKKTKE